MEEIGVWLTRRSTYCFQMTCLSYSSADMMWWCRADHAPLKMCGGTNCWQGSIKSWTATFCLLRWATEFPVGGAAEPLKQPYQSRAYVHISEVSWLASIVYYGSNRRWHDPNTFHVLSTVHFSCFFLRTRTYFLFFRFLRRFLFSFPFSFPFCLQPFYPSRGRCSLLMHKRRYAPIFSTEAFPRRPPFYLSICLFVPFRSLLLFFLQICLFFSFSPTLNSIIVII